MPTLTTRRGIAALVAVGALLTAAFAAVPQADAATLYACVKKNGTAHIYAKKPRCKRHESKLSWNTEGIAGKNGLNGLNGINGAAGKEGPAGKEGKEGKEGPGGEAGPIGQGRAFATIKPGAPAEIKPGSRGVISATTFLGITCVFLEPSIDLTQISPVVTNQFGDVTYSAFPGACSSGGKQGIQVNGFNQDGSSNSTSTFNILVP